MKAEWIMVLLTLAYVICTLAQIKSQNKQMEVFLTKEKNCIIKRYIIVALICISRRHASSGNINENHCTAVEIHSFLVEKNYISKNEYSFEDIFYLCLELHSEGQVYFTAPESIERIGDGELQIDLWKFSKRAAK